jgi:hypothetical protein
VSEHPKELIVVRQLVSSDLGLFDAQRSRVRSKQRALNINAVIAARMLSPAILAAGTATIECTCVYRGRIIREPRKLKKTHKNWRLGGKKITGEEFAGLRPGDFAVIRCSEGNDGGTPLAMSFVSQAHDSLEHSGLAKILVQKLTDGMAVFDGGTEDFTAFMHLCPRELIVIRSLAESDLGVFSAHRPAVASKQRAFNINARIVRQMLSPPVFDAGGADFDCPCAFKSRSTTEMRPLKKSSKNWRLGGAKFEWPEFKELGCKDFLLIRSVEWNDGKYPLALSFVTKKNQRVAHAGLADKASFTHSMAAIVVGTPLAGLVAKYCPGSTRAARSRRKPSTTNGH